MNNICKTSIAVALGSFFAMSSYAKDVLVVWEDLNKAHSIDMAVADFEKNNDCKVVVREFNPVMTFLLSSLTRLIMPKRVAELNDLIICQM